MASFWIELCHATYPKKSTPTAQTSTSANSSPNIVPGSHYLRCWTQKSFNWSYRATVKIPSKAQGLGSGSGSAPKWNGLLLMRHLTRQKIHENLSTSSWVISKIYPVLNFPYPTMVKIPSKNRRSVSRSALLPNF